MIVKSRGDFWEGYRSHVTPIHPTATPLGDVELLGPFRTTFDVNGIAREEGE